MKNLFKALAIAATTAVALTSCQKEADFSQPLAQGDFVMNIHATNPESVATKTTMDGTTPSWLEGDQVRVLYKTSGNDNWLTAVSNELDADKSSATFTTKLSSPDTRDAYAYYPVNALDPTSTHAKLTIAASQAPKGTAFDGASDLLISKPFTPAASVSTQFSRLGAVLRIKIKNDDLNDEKIQSLSVTGANPLVGNVLVRLSDATVTGIEGGSNTVTATYVPAKQFTVGAADQYVYLIVYPQTLSSGSTLTIAGETENTTFSQAYTLSETIHLNPGHIVPLNVTLASYTPKDKVFLEARFDDNEGTGGNDGNWSGTIASSDIVLPNSDWSATNGKGADRCVKFGTGSAGGSLLTEEITIPSVYSSLKLSFKAAAWDGSKEGTTLSISSSNSNIKDDLDNDVTTVTLVKGEWTEYDYIIKNITGDVAITFSTSGGNKRFFLDDVCVYYGTKPKVKEPAGLAYAVNDIKKVVGDDNFTNALTNPHGLTVNYSSDNTTVAEVNSSTGEVTIKAVGTAYITASSEATADYTAGEATYKLTVSATAEDPITETIDFESAQSTYTSFWTFSSFKTDDTAITAHGGSKYCTTGGTTTWSVKTNNKIPTPKSITFYVSKTSNNTTSSSWKVQYSSNGTDWTDANTASATSMNKGNWNEVTHTFTTQSNVYVRIYYNGSTAVRTIDDISFTYVE